MRVEKWPSIVASDISNLNSTISKSNNIILQAGDKIKNIQKEWELEELRIKEGVKRNIEKKKEQHIKALTNPAYQDLMFFWDEHPRRLESLPLSAADFRLLFVEKSHVLREASSEQLQYLQYCYPSHGYKHLRLPRKGTSERSR